MNKKDTFVPWVEKYRPSKITEIASQTHVVNLLKKLLINKTLPNLILHGPPGTGKTSLINACVNELFGANKVYMIIELNASEERGIDIIRNKVRKFTLASNLASCENESGKIVILDEIDSMTHDAQNLLPKLIDENINNTRFCLICNNINKINMFLRSRCICIKFKTLTFVEIKDTINKIKMKEQIDIADSELKYLVEQTNGDMRKIINILQGGSLITKHLTHDVVDMCLNMPSKTLIDEIFSKIAYCNKKNKNKQEVIDFVIESVENEHLLMQDIITKTCNYLIEKYVFDETLQKTISHLHEIDFNLSINTNYSIEVMTFVFCLNFIVQHGTVQ